MKNHCKFIIIWALFIYGGCQSSTTAGGVSSPQTKDSPKTKDIPKDNSPPPPPGENPKNNLAPDGPAENRFEAAYEDRLVLRRALSSLPAFYGDGQLRWESGGWNGSVFLFSQSTIMTNAHVVTSDNDLKIKRPLAGLEYISFPHVVFYKKSLLTQIKNYEQKRLNRMKADHEKAKIILQTRINYLENKGKKTSQDEIHLDLYKGDLGLLNQYSPIEMEQREFIAIEDGVSELWISGKKSPDIALIVLKKPLNQLINKQAIKNILTNDYFAANNLYDYKRHGRLYHGTPLYLAGYGREGEQGDIFDKNKSMKVIISNRFNAPEKYGIQFLNIGLLQNLSDYEKDFYYYEKKIMVGDSGSRIWAFLDHNGKLSVKPSVLSKNKVSIGIVSHTGGGEMFFQKTLSSVLAPFALSHPGLSQSELASISYTNWITKNSDSIPYLLNLDPQSSKEFLEALYFYFSWHFWLNENITHNYGQAKLWYLVRDYLIFSNAEVGTIVSSPDASFGQFYEKAATAFERRLGDKSPSDLEIEKWVSILIDAKVFNEKEEAVLKNMSKESLFDQLGPNFKVKINNISEPIPLKDYLSALELWVKKQGFNEKHYIEAKSRKKPDQARRFSGLKEILALDD